MRQESFIRREASSQITVSFAGSRHTVLHDASEMRKHRGRISYGSGLRNGSRNVADTIVDDTFFNIARIVMSRLMECLYRAHVVADIDNNGTLFH